MFAQNSLQSFERVGGTRTMTADVRIIAATACSRPTTSSLNVRQQELLDLIHQAARACTVDDLLVQSENLSRGMGTSRRTVQNDLRKLTDMGYLSWQKRGCCRCETCWSGLLWWRRRVLQKISGQGKVPIHGAGDLSEQHLKKDESILVSKEPCCILRGS
jgi:hypothetical protein